MNLSFKITFLFIFLFLKNTFAQNVTILKSDFVNYQTANYMGSNAQFHYFSSYKDGKNYLLKTDIKTLKIVFEEAITFKDSGENYQNMFMCENYVYKISYIGQTIKDLYDGSVQLDEIVSKVKAINLYKYNALTNELIKKEELKITETFTIEDEPKVYEKQRLILIQNTYYDYDLKPLNIKKMEVFSDNTPIDSMHPFEKTYLKCYSYFTKLPIFLGMFYPTNKGLPPIVTTKKTKEIFGFSINYETTTDNSVAVFKEYLHHINVKSRMGILNDLALELPGDKWIIDVHFTTNANKELIILGKYTEVKKESVSYGLFTIKCDSNLNEINPMNLTPLIETNPKNKDLKENIYFALIFNKLEESLYYDVMAKNTQLFFFPNVQIKLGALVNYTTEGGDIFVLLVNKFGELKIVRIPLKQKSRMLSYCLMHIALVDEKVELVYYDHKDNINKGVNETPTLCDLAIENTVMLGFTIDLETLEMSPKKVIFRCDQYNSVPPTFPFKSYYNGYFNANIFFSFREGHIYQFTFN